MNEEAQNNLLQVYHININCTRLERTVAFYELIGFRTVTDLQQPVQGLPTDFAGIGLSPVLALPEDLSGRAVLMAAGRDPRGAKLDIIEWARPIQTGPRRAGLAQPGVARIALKVRDAQATYDTLVAAGHRPYTAPVRVVMDGVPFLVFCVEDPDGVVIEFTQFRDVQ